MYLYKKIDTLYFSAVHRNSPGTPCPVIHDHVSRYTENVVRKNRVSRHFILCLTQAIKDELQSWNPRVPVWVCWQEWDPAGGIRAEIITSAEGDIKMPGCLCQKTTDPSSEIWVTIRFIHVLTRPRGSHRQLLRLYNQQDLLELDSNILKLSYSACG